MTPVPPANSMRHLWVFWGFVAIAGFFLLTEHTAHLLGVLPYLLLAACPLMHVFMHHGHAGHRRGHGHAQPPPNTDEEDTP
ncbi:DUF2933 domain-containing protein [Pseudomonas sp. N040]|uniref:DUF2933 domain-containing protein n=2 Tax=Pseudomonas sp. N040 TaxID=2785325 RepID=UPI0018A2CECD|nr:DUF2933 domain-containing protein [Pseudomonas sp. N040]